ncbi:hypothetical protein GE061_002105 [Apolygus lucorum]|uniref:Uncharacterized protein n=1 Tax=Apolygus lucorum TaxID=248454 RepID=A0A6A4JHE5_APOLU|nr:hypothetical protein GE061_002105 [Apolygus lucorum]
MLTISPSVCVSPVMQPSLIKRSPFDTLQDIVNSILFPFRKGRSETFSKWKSPSWSTVPESSSWLASRRDLEGAEGLWRIEDGIYDLRDYLDKHPGGRDWIELTQGTDITEMFKSHHVSDAPREMLNKFYVRDAKMTRNSPFTFHPDGFYEVLRTKIRDKTQHLRRGPSLKSRAFADFLLTMTVITSVAAMRTKNKLFALTAGLLLACTTICAHNFFHQRDHWRRYYFQLSCMSVKDWRVSHALSHHMFPNTPHDLEVAMFEPWLQWLPKKKMLFWRYVSWVYSPIVYILIFPSSILIRWGISGNDGFPELVPLLVPLAMMLGSGMCATEAFMSAAFWWVVILLIASFTFGLVGLNAGHHHPGAFHDGDIVKDNEKMDWGVYQVLAVRERQEVSDSILGLLSFGDHCLHHLFPTLDHTTLSSLYPEFLQTCQEYGLELRSCSLWEAVRGQFLQLSRVRKRDFSSKHR